MIEKVLQFVKRCVTLFNMNKEKIIGEFQKTASDTGSPAVQVALLTEKIANLTKHLQENPKDVASKRGLTKMVSDRKRMLKYLKKVNLEEWRALKEKLGLR